jgi:hypothetical protein
MGKINLGDEVKDTISGFTGVAVARTEWITGCPRVVVQPKVKKDGILPDNNTFDETTLVVTKAVKPKEVNRAIGGPRQREQKY